MVNYGGDVIGWMYAPESKDTVANLLVSIGTVASGSAGGSLHPANALLDGSEDPAILDDAGVTDEWKNHTDLEPFNAA